MRPPLHILTIAELDWRNGHEHALEAVAELLRRRVRLAYRIVGQGPFLEAVAFARHQMNLEPYVEVNTEADTAPESEHFAWADVFVLAAVSAGATHRLRAAVAAGLPAIIADAPGLVSEPLEGRIIRFPRRDASAMADALQQLAEELARRTESAEEADSLWSRA